MMVTYFVYDDYGRVIYSGPSIRKAIYFLSRTLCGFMEVWKNGKVVNIYPASDTSEGLRGN